MEFDNIEDFQCSGYHFSSDSWFILSCDNIKIQLGGEAE
jgi:hypothetical protein